MKEWLQGAAINMIGSVAINFGTNLLKLAHNQREQAISTIKGDTQQSIIYFQTWWIGLSVFVFGNIFNFLSFGYAAQSLLAALGSVQFVSNVGFAYFVLNEKVTGRNITATLFIVMGNIFLVVFGNHQSKVYSQEELLTNYGNHVYLIYCVSLIILVTVNQMAYKKGRILLSHCTDETVSKYWHTLLPFSYAMVSGIVGSHSVLFAKSLSVLLRQAINGDNEFDGWFTYVILILFISTASFWMTRLNDGLALFDAVIIVPMFQIVWTFFSIFTGFVYFAEYQVFLHSLKRCNPIEMYQNFRNSLQVFDSFRTSIFVLGILTLFLGILMLGPDDTDGSKLSKWTDDHEESSAFLDRHQTPMQEQMFSKRSSVMSRLTQIATKIVIKAKNAWSLWIGLLDNQANVTSVFAMPMLASSRMAWRSSGARRHSSMSSNVVIASSFEHLESCET